MCGLGVVLLLAGAGGALAEVHYVDLNCTNATPPYTNWATAAIFIQAAVDAAVEGDEIVVTNGIYFGGVKVSKPLSLRSINGPQTTVIDGIRYYRCMYLADKDTVSGFTLQNGYVARGQFDDPVGGAGVECAASSDAVVSNCIITGNRAFGINSGFIYGGGAYGGTLNNCVLSNNSVGALLSTNLSGSIESYGGGAALCTLNNCTLIDNSSIATNGNYAFWASRAVAYGGGAAWCTLNSCALYRNYVQADGTYPDPQRGFYGQGGGTAFCTVNNSTISRNLVVIVSAGVYPPEFGGAYDSGLFNCISYFNYPGNYDPDTCFVTFGCTTPQPTDGSGNITNDPLFVDLANGNLRLQSNSPCINAGSNAFAPAGTDLDGNPRIAGGTVDIGAYEFQAPISQISYTWLQQYGLPINATTDSADLDGDGVDNYHEWLAGTDPTNSLSSPAQLTITPSGVPPSGIILTWSTNAVGFTLQSTTNLFSPAVWSTNSPAPIVVNGQNTVTNPIVGPQQFYRLSQ